MKKFFVFLFIMLAVSAFSQERIVRRIIFFDTNVDSTNITSTESDTSEAFDMWSHTSIQFHIDTLAAGGNPALQVYLLTSSTYQDSSYKTTQIVVDSLGAIGWYPEQTLESPVTRRGKLVINGLATNLTSVFKGWVNGWSNDVNANGR